MRRRKKEDWFTFCHTMSRSAHWRPPLQVTQPVTPLVLVGARGILWGPQDPQQVGSGIGYAAVNPGCSDYGNNWTHTARHCSSSLIPAVARTTELLPQFPALYPRSLLQWKPILKLCPPTWDLHTLPSSCLFPYNLSLCVQFPPQGTNNNNNIANT